MNRMSKLRVLIFAGCIFFFASQANATIDYGQFMGVTINYNVSEDNQGLFERPRLSGDTLLFSPTGFGVVASGAGGFADKDGTLQIVMEAKPNRYIGNIIFQEQGDYTLQGIGTAGTFANVSCSVLFRIEKVDGNPLLQPVQVSTYLTFTPSDGTYNLAQDGPAMTRVWSGGMNFDVSSALRSVGIYGQATQVTMSLDNYLIVMSENGTVARIKKKQADGVGITVTPEPATLCMLALGSLFLARRKK